MQMSSVYSSIFQQKIIIKNLRLVLKQKQGNSKMTYSILYLPFIENRFIDQVCSFLARRKLPNLRTEITCHELIPEAF